MNIKLCTLRCKVIFGSTLVALWLAAPLSFGIGRSGNGKLVSAEMGFIANEPALFPTPQNMGRRNLRLISPITGMGSAMRPQFIELRELTTVYPQMQTMDRMDIVDFANQGGWSKETLPLSPSGSNACIEAFSTESPTALTVFAAWGGGKGVVIIGPLTAIGREAVFEILHSLELTSGACEWN